MKIKWLKIRKGVVANNKVRKILCQQARTMWTMYVTSSEKNGYLTLESNSWPGGSGCSKTKARPEGDNNNKERRAEEEDKSLRNRVSDLHLWGLNHAFARSKVSVCYIFSTNLLLELEDYFKTQNYYLWAIIFWNYIYLQNIKLIRRTSKVSVCHIFWTNLLFIINNNN